MNAVLPDQGPDEFGPAHVDYAPGGRRGDTRARIQQVALELFAEQGYEGTSLREIAERLGVTKAALYYHFKSKEDIVRSFTEDYFARLDGLIAWGRDQPPAAHTSHELLDRYISIVMEGGEVFRFLERNQASLRGSEHGKHRFEQFRPRMNALVEIITGPDAQPARGSAPPRRCSPPARHACSSRATHRPRQASWRRLTATSSARSSLS